MGAGSLACLHNSEDREIAVLRVRLSRKLRVLEIPRRSPIDVKHERTWNVFGEQVICKAASEDTRGAFSMFEVASPPGCGPPLHLHEREGESFYLLEGKLVVQSGERRFSAKPGIFVRFPRGTVHGYRNVTDREVRLLVMDTPGGYEAVLPLAG